MTNELNNYLETVLTNCHYPVAFCGDKSNVLNRWLIKTRQANDMDPDRMSPAITMEGRILLNTELAFAKPEDLENNWFYHVEDNRMALNFQQPFYEYNHFEKYLRAEKDKCLYALCDVYCTESRLIHFFVSAISPIRIWINGQLVYTSSFEYHIRPFRFIYRFLQGNNSILVEQTGLSRDFTRSLLPAEFMLKIQPVDYLKENGTVHYFSEQIIDDLKYTYAICPDKAIYRQQEAIGLVILPRFFTGVAEEAIVTAADGNGAVLKNWTVTVPGQLLLDIDPRYEGVLDITVTARAQSDKNARILVYRGDINRKRDALISSAGEKSGCNADLIDNFTKLSLIPDDSGLFIRGSQELMFSDFHKLILEKWQEFERYITSGRVNGGDSFLTVYKQDALLFYNSDIDDGFLAYRLHLPVPYTPDKKYPLVILLFFGFGNSRYPDFILERYKEKETLGRVVVASMPARSAFNRDYINEMNYFKVIAQICQYVNVDKEQIYIMGSCTGGMEGLGLALKAPHVFAGIGSTWSTPRMDNYNPDYNYLKNLDNLTTYHLLNIEDNIFNFPKLVHTLKYIRKAKAIHFINLSHIEVDFLTDYRKVFDDLVGEQAERYPAGIEYTVTEPIYNRAYWVVADYINNLNHRGFISARIAGPESIEIKTDNIGKLHLLIDREALHLGRDIQLMVNEYQQTLHIDDYTLVHIDLRAGTLQSRCRALSRAVFQEQYDQPLIDETRLGIKQVHSGKCVIVRSEPQSGESRDLMKKLIMLLKQPLKERIRSYRYSFCTENDFQACHTDQGNFIYPIDARELSDFQRSLLAQTNVAVEPDGITCCGNTCSGDYFALIKCRNPFAHNHFALFIIYNSSPAAQELIKFWSLFDSNNLFYSDLVIYHNGNYLDFRNENAGED